MPTDNQLDLRFDVDKSGISPLGSKAITSPLLSVSIPECEYGSFMHIMSLALYLRAVALEMLADAML